MGLALLVEYESLNNISETRKAYTMKQKANPLVHENIKLRK